MRRLALVAAAASAAAVLVPLLAGGAVGTPTYYGEVGTILNEHCAGCHSVGGVAPFPLASAADARKYARAIAAVVKTGTMPPWPPGPRSPAFVGRGARVLSPAEQRTLAAWAAAGAPAGRARALPVPAANTAPRGSRVLTLQPRRAYTPRAADGGLDDYRCFLLDPKLRRDTFVTGALIRPQQAGIVHHVILFEAAGAQAAAATALDRRSGGKGWTCFGGPGLPIDLSSPNVALRFGSPQWIAAWVPGHVTNDLPRGLGVRLHRGAKIVMQVHYNLMHGARPDRSRAVLTTAPRGAKLQPLETMLTAAPVELPCPGGARGPRCSRAHEVADAVARFGFQGAALPEALLQLCGKTLADYPRAVGDGRSISTSCDRRIDRPMTVRSVAGHMHLRGREISLVLDPGTPRERTLLHIPRWDFHWQDAYYLRDPVRLRPGDRIRLSCTFDNSAAGQPALGSKPLAPRYVLWGEGTTDEMCLGLLAVTLG